jgi:hypothetical protein
MEAFIAACEVRRAELENVFEIPLRHNLRAKPIQQLGDILKKTLMLGNASDGGKTQPDGKKKYSYTLDAEKLDALQYWHGLHTDEARKEAWQAEKAAILREYEAKRRKGNGPDLTELGVEY